MGAITGLSNLERQEELLRFIEQCKRVTVNDICERFDVSLATCRRDLEVLAEQGKIRRIHGGAISIRNAPPEPPVLLRSNDQIEEKKRIGQAAADLIQDGETIFLGSGTTVLEVARNLKNRYNLTVITNSLLVVNELADVPEISLVALGGILRRSEYSLIGHIAQQSLSEVRADKVIIGIRAFDLEQGLTNDYLPETMTDRAILQIGRQVIVVADHTKIGCVSIAFVAPVTSIHTLVTDNGISPEFASILQEKKIQLIVA
jgi:DeoR family transcriptional regulator of aga operon